MSQKQVELILARQLASYLATPIFIVDAQGALIYYNEPAESILGHGYEATGEMALEEWTTMYAPTDDKGVPFPADALPLVVALDRRTPASGRLWIRGLDGVRRHIEVMAFPLIGQDDRYLGAIALFAELEA